MVVFWSFQPVIGDGGCGTRSQIELVNGAALGGQPQAVEPEGGGQE
jgi:hypothetical protein